MSGKQQRPLQCAIYTRKSTEEGLDQEFNTLDAQRESAEAYIKSQAAEGWQGIVTRYDDGGFTGANIDRPALRRLLADIEAGKVDVVVVYKVDRLSRSLLDFAKLLEVFDKHHVAFVSVTQQFNTTTSMGRLMLNVLLSFAQFEREIISERTRDKMGAARRKGKWLGGKPVLGYDVDPRSKQLVVQPEEAAQVRAIFELYRDQQALLPVVQELARRGWVNKRWTNKQGATSGGVPFTKTSLHRLLTNVTYCGQVSFQGEILRGEQPALVTTEVWQQVQMLLKRNGRNGGATVRNRFGAILKGLLVCQPCGCAMSPMHSTKGNKRYRYYVCTHAQKLGWDSCPSKSIPAAEIERFVVEQIRQVAQQPAVVRATLAQVQAQSQQQLGALAGEQRLVEQDLTHWQRELHEVATTASATSQATARLADLQERIASAERRRSELDDQIGALARRQFRDEDVAATIMKFDPIWQALTPREQTRLVELLVSQVRYDGRHGKVSITFREEAWPLLAQELSHPMEVA